MRRFDVLLLRRFTSIGSLRAHDCVSFFCVYLFVVAVDLQELIPMLHNAVKICPTTAPGISQPTEKAKTAAKSKQSSASSIWRPRLCRANRCRTETHVPLRQKQHLCRHEVTGGTGGAGSAPKG
ncbi:unnamed protein product [Ectocarpus sp. 12 AP-2014]